jgi:uncharacterized small protein (DUF1192 family)
MLGKKSFNGEITMPKSKSVQVDEKEIEDGKQYIKEKVDEFKERKAIIKHQLDQLKAEGREKTCGANASWTGTNVYLIYDELQNLYEGLGTVIEEIFRIESQTNKMSGEWQKKKAILNRYKVALDKTDQVLLGNK